MPFQVAVDYTFPVPKTTKAEPLSSEEEDVKKFSFFALKYLVMRRRQEKKVDIRRIAFYTSTPNKN